MKRFEARAAAPVFSGNLAVYGVYDSETRVFVKVGDEYRGEIYMGNLASAQRVAGMLNEGST